MLSIIPITAAQGKTFASKIPVDGKNLVLNFKLFYNILADLWHLDIADQSFKALITGLPLVPAGNLLEQFQYLNIGSAFLSPAEKLPAEWPGYDTLQSKWYLIWGDTDESVS